MPAKKLFFGFFGERNELKVDYLINTKMDDESDDKDDTKRWATHNSSFSPIYTIIIHVLYILYWALQLTVMTRRRRQTRICADNRNSCVRQCFNLCKGKNLNWNRNVWMNFPRKAKELWHILFNLLPCLRKWKIPSWDVVNAILVFTLCPGNTHPRGNPVESNSELQLTVTRAWFDFWPQNLIQT